MSFFGYAGPTPPQNAVVNGKRWIVGDARPETLQSILDAYDRWGDDTPAHLAGDFAFAIWDGATRELFCARDHFGVRPFYYSRSSDAFAFASGIASLRRLPFVSDTPNDDAVADFLLFSVNRNRATTTFADIQVLPAAHSMRLRDGEIVLREYWQLPIEEPFRVRDPREIEEGFLDVLRRAVDERVTSDRITFSLSGGLDSSSVTALAVESARSRFSAPRLVAFTDVFDPLIADEEREYATLAAQHLGIEIEFVEGAHRRLFEDFPEKQEPTNDPLAAVTVEQFRRAAAVGPLMFAGQGGDAVLYASHNYFFQLLRTGRWLQFGSDVMTHLLTKRRLPPLGLRSSIKRTLGMRAAAPTYPSWIAPPLESRFDLRDRWRAHWDYQPDIHPTRPQAFNLLRGEGWQRLNEYTDAEAMGVEVEYRNPLLDVRVVEYLLRVPPMPWFAEKEILRRVMRGRLPERVRTRRKRNIDTDPAHIWMTRQCQELCTDILARDELGAYVDRQRVCAAMRDPRRTEYDSFLLALPLSLGRWLKRRI